MSKLFDMELFLAGVLTGSHATRQRHLRQAKAIQSAITDHWQRDNPWTWQRKHLVWFFDVRLARSSPYTRAYYLGTAHLVCKRAGKAWTLCSIKSAAPG
ncbi:hypothetical protein QLG06_11425 [Pseudomonas sp. V104_6]|nr:MULTISPECIES: hypothetical protein [unclassified Pseudomonas]MCP3789423.1 hypothetical protein [Pseudomonas sp. N2-11]MDI3374940.1 hypothetical protein [Pseudomonas sp. V104_6]